MTDVEILILMVGALLSDRAIVLIDQKRWVSAFLIGGMALMALFSIIKRLLQ